MAKIEKPKFYAFYKDFNDGKIHVFDVLDSLFDEILNKRGGINKKKFIAYDWNNIGKSNCVSNKKECMSFINSHFMDRYWARCECEFIAVDWPYRDYTDISCVDRNGQKKTFTHDGLINNSRPVKIDVYEQLKPNLPVITDLVWNYIEPKLKKNE